MLRDRRGPGRHSRRQSDLSDYAPRDRRLSQWNKTLITAIGAILCLAVLVSLVEGAFQRQADAATIARQRDALLKAERSASDAARNSSDTASKVSQLSKLLAEANKHASDSQIATASLQQALSEHGYSSVVHGDRVIVIKGPLPKSLADEPGASQILPSPHTRPSRPAMPRVAPGRLVAPGLHRKVPAVVRSHGKPSRGRHVPPPRGRSTTKPTASHKAPRPSATSTTSTTHPAPVPTATGQPTVPLPTSTTKPPLPIPTVTVTIPGLPPIVLLTGVTQATQSAANLLSEWAGTITATAEGAR